LAYFLRSMALCAAAVSLAAQTCTIPSQVPQTRPTRVDGRKDVPTDYYFFALSWSPAFCAQAGGRSKFQCVDNSFAFVVHGLWPQSASAQNSQGHPRNCKAPEALAGSLTRRFLCIIPDAQLIQDEWNKHGACAFPNAQTYLEREKTLWEGLQKPDISNLPRFTPARKIREAWVAANQRAGLKAENISIAVRSGNVFEEARVCYDKQFKFTRCLQRGTPDDQEVRVIPKPR